MFDATTLKTQLRAAKMVGVLRAPTAEAAVQASLAAIRGGLKAIELTFTTPDAPHAIEKLRSQLPEGVLLGAGTVTTPEQAALALEAGAHFLVSPHLGEDVLETAHLLGIPYLPGVLTPTEIHRAHCLKAELLKIFPIGSSGGAAYLKDLLGPFPDLQAMVTGSVGPKEVKDYLDAGAIAVGVGSNLFPKEAIAQGNWDAVEQATRTAFEEAGLGG
ncbi:bifunctional 4-hydroxy-2-oxoglutarate aldolase/2-dehydro-3-deoxy-phosphogluconate aldolase [Deinococcus roseus]|uniref:KHG-KDPG bifunctional aldolase n=1 Tax=Deinococcus roseus TaxID=392414 RepID=A0ABQ2CZJ8_9DEIO|nr:bifunctional 4-hydroxy-2-oxoglutarate aldolase/2-dehydro-3-deoxy-phosphogluconate aldolase [Deinococcus roseus]GGJ30019.1 KHG-KDPG bifunctional aldolase [Deinococcus roseus]